MRGRSKSLLVAAALVWGGVILDAAPGRACRAFVAPQAPSGPPAELASGPVKVLLSREGSTTTLVLGNEVQGALRKFSIMIPIPARIRERDVKVLDTDPFAQLEGVTAPSVIPIVDPNPCGSEAREEAKAESALAPAPASSGAPARAASAKDYGVEVEGHFEVGDYDMALLAAKDARGLSAWLRRFKYQVSPQLEALMADYLEHGTRFLVVRVHLKKLVQGQVQRLRPLQISYESPEIVLPVRIAAVDRETPTDFLLYALSPEGKMDVGSHAALQMPTDLEVPGFVADSLDEVHEDVLRQKAAQFNEAVALLEYSGPASFPGALKGIMSSPSAWVTRYRLRVSRTTHDDMKLFPSPDRVPYRVVYRAHRPWQPSGHADRVCDAGKDYLRALKPRVEQQVATLARLTGRSPDAVRTRMGNVVVLELPSEEPASAPELGEPRTAPPVQQATVRVASRTGWITAGALFLSILVLIGLGRWLRAR